MSDINAAHTAALQRLLGDIGAIVRECAGDAEAMADALREARGRAVAAIFEALPESDEKAQLYARMVGAAVVACIQRGEPIPAVVRGQA